MWPRTMSQSSEQRQRVERLLFRLGREAGDQVGADRDLGARRLEPLDHRHRLRAAVTPLHPLEHPVVAGLQRQVKMRLEAGFLGEQREQPVVDLDRVERGQPQPRQLGHQRQHALDELTEALMARQVGAVAGRVDAGQHDLAIAVGDERADALDHAAGRDPNGSGRAHRG